MRAPEGKVLRVSGTDYFNVGYSPTNAGVSIYDGTDANSTAYFVSDRREDGDTISFILGENVTLSLRSENIPYPKDELGIAYKVTVLDPAATYGITLHQAEGGTVAADLDAPTAGSVVTLTATPADGNHRLADVGIVDGEGNPVDVAVDFVSNTATFVMPSANVSVTPVFTDNLTAAGGLYVNMPVNDTKTINVPAGVTSFKVYDDGGKDGRYSMNSEGFLELNVPDGFSIQVTGKIWINQYDFYSYLTIYDGNTDAPPLVEKLLSPDYGMERDIGMLTSTGNVVTIDFNVSGGKRYDGFDLTVKLLPKTKYAAVSIVEDDAHKKYGIIDGMYNGKDAINIPSPIAVDTLIFKREFSTQGYSTIMLPFGIEQAKVDGISQVLDFDGVTEVDGELQVNMVVHDGDLEANHPYMLSLSEETLTFHGGVTINSMSDPAIRKGDWVFHGTLAKKVWKQGDAELGKAYGFAAEQRSAFEIGDFVQVGAGSWVRPLRAYMIKQPVANPAPRYAFDWTSGLDTDTSTDSLPERIKVVIVERGEDSEDGEEHTTVIGHINTRTGEFTMERNYDLKGRKLNGKPKARGAYYGKKVLVK